jgi:hypothetical protein
MQLSAISLSPISRHWSTMCRWLFVLPVHWHMAKGDLATFSRWQGRIGFIVEMSDGARTRLAQIETGGREPPVIRDL